MIVSSIHQHIGQMYS